ncbi:hypothetical protein BT69DRAFT_1338562, partial [Atractiella rhizophila]
LDLDPVEAEGSGWKGGFSLGRAKPHLKESQAKLGSPLVLDNPHFVKPEMAMELDDVMFRDREVEPELEMGLIKDEDE